jgi:hypothetical protein
LEEVEAVEDSEVEAVLVVISITLLILLLPKLIL